MQVDHRFGTWQWFSIDEFVRLEPLVIAFQFLRLRISEWRSATVAVLNASAVLNALVFLYGAVILSEAKNLIACPAVLNALAFLYGAVILSKAGYG